MSHRKLFVAYAVAVGLVFIFAMGALGATHIVVGNVKSFVIDIAHAVPVEITAPIELDSGEIITVTAPITVNVELRVSVDGQGVVAVMDSPVENVEISPIDTTENTSTPSATPTPVSIKSSTSSVDDGTYIVGQSIQPGTYRSTAEAFCYWARLRGFGGILDDIIANGNNSPEIVTISDSDVGFETTRCGQWLPVESTAPSTPLTQFGNGTYMVGLHIAPGTYQSDGDGLCYWARLSDFSHELDGIIANSTNPTIVTIDPSDAGFTTFGCGEWSRR